MQGKMDLYNSKNPGNVQMTFENIQIDHIKPAKAFGDEINHYTNLQPLLPEMNAFKKAKWSQQDEVFWRENIRNNTDYTDIYMGKCGSHVTQHNIIGSLATPDYKFATKNPMFVVKKTILEVESEIQELKKELTPWKDGMTSANDEIFDGRLACVREFHKNMKNDDQLMQLSHSKQHLNAVIASYKGHGNRFARMRIDNIFLSAAMTICNQNMLFGVYTIEKLLKIKEYDHNVENDFPNAHTVCTSVLLLHELIEVFNEGLAEDMHLKTYDITLSQTKYNEDDEVEVPDHVWQLFVHKCRSVKKQPTTRRALMGAIFMLSHRTFGKFFTTKTVTSRSKPCKKGGSKQIRCYDYVGDDMFLRVHVQLADWSKRELADIEPAIVAKYNLKERQELDVEKMSKHSENHTAAEKRAGESATAAEKQAGETANHRGEEG